MATPFHPAGLSGGECASSCLDLWSKPLVETAVLGSYISEYEPSNGLVESSNSIQFRIPSSSDFTDLSQSYFMLKVKITKSTGADLSQFVQTDAAAVPPTVNNSVAFVQNVANSIFSNLSFRVNEELLSDSFGTQHYTSYMQQILNYSEPARKSRLTLLGWSDDENPSSNDAAAAAASTGYKKRAEWTAESKEATFISNIFTPLCSQDRYLLPYTPLFFEWTKSTPEFCLHSNAPTPNFKYKITSMRMNIRRIKVQASVKMAIENKLVKQPALYPIRYAFCKPLFIDQGLKSVSWEDVFNGRNIPNCCAISFVTQESFRGTQTTSPYNFETFQLSHLRMTIDSEIQPSPVGFYPEYVAAKRKNWTKEYLSLQNDEIKLNDGKFITYSNFATGNAIYFFNFGREYSQGQDCTEPKMPGRVRLDVNFNSASNNAALTALIYTESDEIIAIDSQRRVTRDFFL